VELAWLKSFFLHRLKSWVRIAFQSTDHLRQLHLNQGRDCWKLKGRFFAKPGGFVKQNKRHDCKSDLYRDRKIGIELATGIFRT
jgi:hypothetical protein